jgi:hypothetical protein
MERLKSSIPSTYPYSGTQTIEATVRLTGSSNFRVAQMAELRRYGLCSHYNVPMASRREILTAIVAALPLAAQTPAPVPTSPTPEQPAAKALADVQQTKQKLAEIQVPMSIEPSFRFVP